MNVTANKWEKHAIVTLLFLLLLLVLWLLVIIYYFGFETGALPCGADVSGFINFWLDLLVLFRMLYVSMAMIVGCLDSGSDDDDDDDLFLF